MVQSSISYKGHMVEYLYMGGLKLKTIPCSLVKSFPRLRWWDLRFLLYMANVLPLYCCQHIIANILYCQSISCSNCLPSNSRDNRIIHLPPALAYHPCLEVPCILCIWKRNTKCVIHKNSARIAQLHRKIVKFSQISKISKNARINVTVR